MASVTAQEVKVGVLVILAIVLVVVLSASLGNFESLYEDLITIKIRVPRVVVEKYSKVTYAGVRIGTVTDLLYDNAANEALIVARIKRDSPVSLDSEVTFTSDTMLSPLYVEINGGQDDKRITTLLAKGEINEEDVVLEAKPYASLGDFFALASDVKNVLGKVEVVLDDVREPLGKVSGIIDDVSGQLLAISGEVKTMIADAHPRVNGLLDQSSGLIDGASKQVIPALTNVRRGSEDLPALISQSNEKLQSALKKADELIETMGPDLQATVKEVRGLMESMNGRIDDIQSKVKTLLTTLDGAVKENRPDIDGLIANLKQVSSNLNDLSAQLKRDPWRVVWKSEGKMEPQKVSPDWRPLPAGAESK
ncbi:MAG: MCE family protein [bacterium]|nr:MCE family protein [bacterium]